jgi:RNA polymerase I-specific transcription initiation factor RRN3
MFVLLDDPLCLCRYIRPNFEFWSLVKTTYSNNSDDDDELGDIDAPGMNVDSLDDHVEMSITPHRSFYHPMAMSSDSGISMPARIRPSVSPPS